MTRELPSLDNGASDPRGVSGPVTMDGEPSVRPHAPSAVDSLRQAMRRARVDNAERASVVADLRSARLVRLELLEEELKPLVAQIPPDADMFDVVVLPGVNPRLFIDMIGFVEIGRNAKVYRLLQDTRHGRITVAESEDIGTMVDAVTDYVARRLLERDEALAADRVDRAPPAARKADDRRHLAGSPARNEETPRPSGENLMVRARPRFAAVRWLSIAFAFLIDLLGSIALFTLVAITAWYLWNRLQTPV